MCCRVIHPLLELNMVVMTAFLALFLFFLLFFFFSALERMEAYVVEASLLWVILVLLLDFEDNISTLSILFRVHDIETTKRRWVWDEFFAFFIGGRLNLCWFVFFLLFLLFFFFFSLFWFLCFLYEFFDRFDLFFLSLNDLFLLDNFLFLFHHRTFLKKNASGGPIATE